jgi:hypothetical protein
MVRGLFCVVIGTLEVLFAAFLRLFAIFRVLFANLVSLFATFRFYLPNHDIDHILLKSYTKNRSYVTLGFG